MYLRDHVEPYETFGFMGLHAGGKIEGLNEICKGLSFLSDSFSIEKKVI